MRLVPKDWDKYNPILFLMGAGFAVAGGWGFVSMGVSGPLAAWVVRGVPATLLAIGWILMTRQFHLGDPARSHGEAVTQ
jgi:hypothetical protein